jgi:ABC-type transporter Mla MlaB component
MAIITCKRKNGSLYVSFGNDTSIRFASRIKSALYKIIPLPVKKYYLDLSEVKETDITFIQLLIAFNEKLKTENRSMIILKPAVQSGFMITADECGVDVNSLFEIEDG